MLWQLFVSLWHGMFRLVTVGSGLHPGWLSTIFTESRTNGIQHAHLWPHKTWIEHFGFGLHPHGFSPFFAKCLLFGLGIINLWHDAPGIYDAGIGPCANGPGAATSRIHNGRLCDIRFWPGMHWLQSLSA